MSELETGRPVVKTLLLTDFVESTQFVAALGDIKAAEIFAAHDHAARELLSEHGGQEIDKSDGFLFLFDRPIDAVRFSLAYHRLLMALSEDLPRPLEARSGIHLGEVVMRTNPSDDVSRGAKPVEVEGLAKAKTARVMACACAKQTLLSESAYTIGHRAAVGADGLDESVRWVEHGLYPLKGLEKPVRLYEVGRQGEAHLTAPPGALKSPHSSTLLPLMALLVLVGVVGSFVWSTMQSPPPSPSPPPVEAPRVVPKAPKQVAPPSAVQPSSEASSAEVGEEPDAVNAAPERAEESPQMLEVRVSATPSGAEIFYGEEHLGRAPVILNVPRRVGDHPIQARLQGYRTKQALCRVSEADLTQGSASCEVVLKKHRRAKTKRPSAHPSPAKRAPADDKPKIHMID